jgi:hypothetical protein
MVEDQAQIIHQAMIQIHNIHTGQDIRVAHIDLDIMIKIYHIKEKGNIFLLLAITIQVGIVHVILPVGEELIITVVIVHLIMEEVAVVAITGIRHLVSITLIILIMKRENQLHVIKAIMIMK